MRFPLQVRICFDKFYIMYWRMPEYNATRFSFSIGVALLFGSILWKLGANVYAPSANPSVHCLQPRTARLHPAVATPEHRQGMAATALTPGCCCLACAGPASRRS